MLFSLLTAQNNNYLSRLLCILGLNTTFPHNKSTFLEGNGLQSEDYLAAIKVEWCLLLVG